MAQKSVIPSIKETAFNCPHCGAYTTQTWFELYGTAVADEKRTPHIHYWERLDEIANDDELSAEMKERLLPLMEKSISGFVVLVPEMQRPSVSRVGNLHISQCFNCKDFSVWIHDRLVFPLPGEGPLPNEDLPPTVRSDYEEASRILNLSPRGSAALLRLSIQKLCVHLGEKGENINDDIASIVKKGLSPMVQQALDAVRVIGNEAVHPGTLDLKDDKDTAFQLFRLVNLIAEQMITNPKHVQEMYDKLPESKKKAIEARDGKGATEK